MRNLLPQRGMCLDRSTPKLTKRNLHLTMVEGAVALNFGSTRASALELRTSICPRTISSVFGADLCGSELAKSSFS